ncbi:MAG: hypothetical protein AB7N65_27910 [Vicinamibacterales bacterium]
MKRSIVVLSALVLVAGIATGVSAQSKNGRAKAATGAPESDVYDAASAMAILQSTAGEWKDTSSNYDIGGPVTVKTKAAGSAVFFNYEQGKPTEMETVFHMDGEGKLMLTHYCAAQNAPVLQFQKSDKPGELKFVFVGGTNFDPKVDHHFHDQVLQVIDANTIEQRTTVWHRGKATDKELIAVLQRQSGARPSTK